MSITFEVIDTNCETAGQSFFVPIINLTAKSTTKFATLHGYNEFVASVPPKKYRKATVSGISERIGYTMEQTPRQCAGAQYVFSGVGEFDLTGKVVSHYSKKFYAQCPKQYWPAVPLQTNPNRSVRAPCPTGTTFCSFVGYCWPPDLNSCSVCDPDIVNWPLISEQAINTIQLDLQAFLHQQPVVTPTTYTVTGQVFAFCSITSPPFTFLSTGNFYNVTVGPDTYQAQSVFTDPPLAFPVVNIGGIVEAYINFVDASNYSAVLSEEYTDADALANATIVTGTGTTAATTPRTTGFTSVFTSVVFTLKMANLIVGQNYLVEVDMWEKGPGVNTHTPKQYGFTAAADTHTITDVVATPANNHTITVQKPTITFAPV